MKNTVRGALKSKTNWFGIALVVLPFVQQEWHVWSGLLPEKYRIYALSVIGLVVIVLRFMTREPLAEKGNGSG